MPHVPHVPRVRDARDQFTLALNPRPAIELRYFSVFSLYILTLNFLSWVRKPRHRISYAKFARSIEEGKRGRKGRIGARGVVEEQKLGFLGFRQNPRRYGGGEAVGLEPADRRAAPGRHRRGVLRHGIQG